MLDYTSFSSLNISVGKLLAGRYEIVRQLRAGDYSLDLLVRDKVSNDELKVLKISPCAEGRQEHGQLLIGGQNGFCFQLEELGQFETGDEESEKNSADTHLEQKRIRSKTLLLRTMLGAVIRSSAAFVLASGAIALISG